MFEVIIKEFKKEIGKKGKEWKVVDQKAVPKQGEGAPYMTDVYGYTPEIETEVAVERVIYDQLVDELDIKAVIRAVNKMNFFDTKAIAE